MCSNLDWNQVSEWKVFAYDIVVRCVLPNAVRRAEDFYYSYCENRLSVVRTVKLGFLLYVMRKSAFYRTFCEDRLCIIRTAKIVHFWTECRDMSCLTPSGRFMGARPDKVPRSRLESDRKEEWRDLSWRLHWKSLCCAVYMCTILHRYPHYSTTFRVPDLALALKRCAVVCMCTIHG